MRTLIVFLPLFILISCSKPVVEQTTPYKPFKTDQLQAGALYAQQKGGASLLVMQNGQIIFEQYHNGASSSTPAHIQSGTKGFFAAVVALAIQEGYISSYEEVIAETITEWQDINRHPGKRGIRLKHLVSLTSGLSQNLDYIQGERPLASDIYQYVVDSLTLVSAPGTRFQYGPSHYYAFGVFLQRKLQNAGINLNPLQYLESKVLQKIGVTYSNWVHDAAGNPHIPNGCYITASNWIKFGQFLLQNGKWNNQQIIQEDLVKELYTYKGANSGHGVFLWLNNQNGDATSAGNPPVPAGSPGGIMYYNGYTDLAGALGAGKNRLYIIPSLNAVIVRQSLDDITDFSDHDFLNILLPQ